MPSVQFTVVDVFSKTPYKGNPLAVVNDLKGLLSDTQMKLITRQFNLSETTFFSQPTLPRATYKLRSFLPDGREVFGVGHNILGAWWFLAQGGFLDFSKGQATRDSGTEEEFVFFQELGGSLTPVKIRRLKASATQDPEFSVSITQATPEAHGQHPDPASLAASIGMRAEDIGFLLRDDGKSTWAIKPRVMSTSTTYHLLVPISSIAALERAIIQKDKLLQQLRLVDERAYGIYLFTNEEHSPAKAGKNSYRARFFSPGMSSEDPATGSAAGPLSVLLHQEGCLDLEGRCNTIEVWQGHQVGRNCVIQVELSQRGSGAGDIMLNMLAAATARFEDYD
ncbi:hypothetical protein B0J13DRAFT_663903 [Dactylonectria estremocensis]|uniref:Phenazine biosynthesis protein n=1 Tax=Dactylonectria estremocensis TaxID=1079267 RepID=A0A9P9CY31_9HYPO|nr:hypothetical protein B0J13DRAFT_663903 [Dactylonectria estremocensis]